MVVVDYETYYPFVLLFRLKAFIIPFLKAV